MKKLLPITIVLCSFFAVTVISSPSGRSNAGAPPKGASATMTISAADMTNLKGCVEVNSKISCPLEVITNSVPITNPDTLHLTVTLISRTAYIKARTFRSNEPLRANKATPTH
jgi:hypothetical protein